MPGVTSLDHIWVKRWNQDILAAKEGLAAVKAEKSWLELNPEELRYIKKSDYDLYLEALLLKSSLLRADNKLQKSSSLIASTFKKHKALKNNHNFKLHFELGLDHWCHEDIPSALDSFMLAEKTAQNTDENVFSLFNLLYCLEALDYEREHIEEKIQKELRYASKETINYFSQQFDSYFLRKDFYNKSKINWTPTKGNIGQADFFACYVSNLPYTKLSNQKELNTIVLEQNYLWQKSYRIRTINGFISNEDLEVFRVADAIDRLYLWTWKFLKDDTHFTIKKIESTLYAIINNLELENLSVENKLLLRNSLHWILIISPKSVSQYTKLINELSEVMHNNYILLEDEFNFQKYIKNNSSYNLNNDNFFYKLYKEISHELPILKKILKKDYNYINQSKKLKLDISNNKIYNLENSKEITSPLLTRLYYLISIKKEFLLSEIQDNFGQNKRQIYNLLSRATKIYPQLEIKINDQVFKHNLESSIFLVVNNYAESKVQKRIIINKRKQSKSELIVSINAIKLIHPKSFKRKHFEEIFKFSKATATRILNEWLENKVITKLGKGRSVEYIWSN